MAHTLNGLGTRIDLVSYMARKPRASASNIDGPILLIQCFKIIMYLYLSSNFLLEKKKRKDATTASLELLCFFH